MKKTFESLTVYLPSGHLFYTTDPKIGKPNTIAKRIESTSAGMFRVTSTSGKTVQIRAQNYVALESNGREEDT